MKHKYSILFSFVISLIWLGIVYRYSNLPPKDTDKYIISRDLKSPFNKSSSDRYRRNATFNDKVQSLKNDMRALKIPLYFDELYQKKSDKNLNGAEDLNSAFELISKAEEGSALLKLVTQYDKLSKAQIRELLENGEVIEVLELVQKAASKEFIDFEIDYSQGAGVLLPHVSPLRDVVRLLSMKSETDMEKGDLAGAVNTLNDGIKLNAMSNDSLNVISGLVGIANSSILNKGIDSLIHAGADLNGTSKLLEIELNNSLNNQLKTLDGERLIFGDWVFNKLIDSQGKFNDDEYTSLFGESAGYIKSLSSKEVQNEYASYLSHMLEIRVLMEEPYYVNSQKMEMFNKKSLKSPISASIVPAYTSVYKKYNESQSSLKKNLLAIKVDEYQRLNGSLPDSLSMLNLPKDYLIDNISGKEFSYESKNGIVKIITLAE
ncbi:MAG: hypothetical protein NE328_01625 [Lentisphaeraceae bacterium]|nr:hypothetical protein [Lentisphaeraceae bacterium]